MKALVTLNNVAMRYSLPSGSGRQAYSVFDGINLELRRGERLGVVGRNGVGKSTLLRIMAKIFAPYSGEVVWAPNVTVSLLSLGLGFRPDLTGRENALLACLLQGLSKQDASAALGSIQSFCEIGDFFDAPVRTYSTGMRARLGFATALANRSDVILIDETLGVGDAAFKERAQETLKGHMTEERGIVIVSHAPLQVKTLCDRAIWLAEGGVAADGKPEDVLVSYAAQS
ncbi:ABC transporter ATP-binding protein [Luminiphilus sp.]|nr:ABC transporter ATP-binding protein [Luminiphilus sp.]